jgi:hypothetical protein
VAGVGRLLLAGSFTEDLCTSAGEGRRLTLRNANLASSTSTILLFRDRDERLSVLSPLFLIRRSFAVPVPRCQPRVLLCRSRVFQQLERQGERVHHA